MKPVIAIAIVLMLAPLASAQRPARRATRPAAPQNTVSQEDRDAIEELHNADISANLALDISALVMLWDDEIVSLPPHSKPVVGKQANREWLEKSSVEMRNTDILAYEEHWDAVRVIGEYAYEYGNIESRTRPSSSRDPKDEASNTYNVMRVLKKQPEGTWKIYRTIWNDQKPLAEPVKEQAKPEKKPEPLEP